MADPSTDSLVPWAVRRAGSRPRGSEDERVPRLIEGAPIPGRIDPRVSRCAEGWMVDAAGRRPSQTFRAARTMTTTGVISGTGSASAAATTVRPAVTGNAIAT